MESAEPSLSSLSFVTSGASIVSTKFNADSSAVSRKNALCTTSVQNRNRYILQNEPSPKDKKEELHCAKNFSSTFSDVETGLAALKTPSRKSEGHAFSVSRASFVGRRTDIGRSTFSGSSLSIFSTISPETSVNETVATSHQSGKRANRKIRLREDDAEYEEEYLQGSGLDGLVAIRKRTPAPASGHPHQWVVRSTLPVEFTVEETPGLFDLENTTLLDRFRDPRRPVRRFFVVDDNVYALYGDKINRYLKHHHVEHQIVVIPVMEADKTMDAVMHITEELTKFGLLRKEPIFAVGGGVLLDIVGLAASLYRRGVPYVRVPTTLLGIVDASVGAKTGINFVSPSKGELKNRMGSYWPPLAALLDRTFLPTVDDRNIRNGVCEMLKMAMVRSPELFEILENYGPGLIDTKFQGSYGDRGIQLSVQLMLEELQPNLWEVDLDRLVDFGHSFSKVMEMRALPELLHGEAVNIDCAFSTILAHGRGMITDSERDRIFRVMHSMRLPIHHELCVPEVLWAGIEDTLEHRDGKQRLPLPSGIGCAEFANDVTFAEIERAAAEMARYVDALYRQWDLERAQEQAKAIDKALAVEEVEVQRRRAVARPTRSSRRLPLTPAPAGQPGIASPQTVFATSATRIDQINGAANQQRLS